MKRSVIRKVLSLTLILSMLMSIMSVTALADGTGSSAIVGADGGYFDDIDFKLFNYSGDTNTNDQVDLGVNTNGVSDFFKFLGSHKQNTAEGYALLPRNTIWDDDGYTADRVKLLPELKDGYPQVDLSRARELTEALALLDTADSDSAAAQAVLDDPNADEAAKAAAQAQLDDIAAAQALIAFYSSDSRYKAFFDANREKLEKLVVPDEVSLGFLFGAGGNGVTAYDPENTILRYDPSTKTYSYDSAENAVDYVAGTGENENRFFVRDYTERTTASDTGYEHDGNDFLPFNHTPGASRGNGTGKDGAYLYDSADVVDYWFGMTMEFDFWMPQGGLIDGEEMKFQFSGDDDVWVFIDDELVMDLGGTHGTVTGEINFATGEVKQYLDWIGSSESNTANVYDQDGKLTKEQTSFPGSFTLPAANQKHTLKFFYLERAVAVANCSMRFNMPVIPAGIVSVAKEVTGDVNGVYDGRDYVFALYDQQGVAQKNVAYTIDDPTSTDVKYTDADTGYFTLKAGERAYFTSFSSDHTGDYYFQEIDALGFAQVSSVVNGGRSGAGAVSDLFHLSPTSGNSVVFTNAMKTGSFRFTKVNTDGEPLAGAAFTLASEDFTATVESDSQGVVTFTDVPYGEYSLSESTAPSGYEKEDTVWTVRVFWHNGVKVALGEYEADADGDLVALPPASGEGEPAAAEPVEPTRFTAVNRRLNSLKIAKTVVIEDVAGTNVHPDMLTMDDLAGSEYTFAVVGVNGGKTVYSNENVSLTVRKVELGEGDGRYDALNGSVELTGLPAGTYTVTELGEDTLTFGGALYTIAVDGTGADNTITLSDGSAHQADVTNTYTYVPETVELKVAKEWQDGGDQDGIRPGSISVQLYADDQPHGQPVLLSESNSWEHIFTGLDKYRDGDVIVYTVAEVEVPAGYTADTPVKNGNTYTITNRHTPAVTSVSGVKSWNDENDADGKRPDEIIVVLLWGGQEVDRQTVTAANGWAYSFTGLPKYASGTLINYSVKEILPQDSEYVASYNGNNIVNSYTPGKTSYTVIKDWQDGNDQDGIRPDSVSVQLYGIIAGETEPTAVGEAVVLSEGNGWSHTWSGLNINRDGAAITYSVREVAVPAGYEAACTQEGSTFTITNTHVPDVVSVTVNKVWSGSTANSLKTEVTMNLYADGEKIATEVIGESDGWSHTWNGLPKNKNGVPIRYSVDEDPLGGYWRKDVASEGNVWTVTNSYYKPSSESLKVVKVWKDNDDAAGLRSESVSVQLLRNGVPYGEAVTLSAANRWSYTWYGLQKNQNWTVAEVDVPEGYLSTVFISGGKATITNTLDDETLPDDPPPTDPGDPKPYSELDDDQPPLATVPATGDATALWAALSLLSGSGLVGLGIQGRRKREDEE